MLFAREGSGSVADISTKGVEETAELIAKAGGKAIAIGADVSKAADVSVMMATTLKLTEGSTARSTMLALTVASRALAESLRQSGRKKPSTGSCR